MKKFFLLTLPFLILALFLSVAAQTPIGGIAYSGGGGGFTGGFIPPFTSVPVNQAGLISITANRASLTGIWHPYPTLSTKICYEIGTTADNTAATYDLGILTGTAGGAGTVIANIGKTLSENQSTIASGAPFTSAIVVWLRRTS